MFEIAKRYPDKTAGLSPAELASWEDGYETAKAEEYRRFIDMGKDILRRRAKAEAIHSNNDPHYRQPRP